MADSTVRRSRFHTRAYAGAVLRMVAADVHRELVSAIAGEPSRDALRMALA